MQRQFRRFTAAIIILLASLLAAASVLQAQEPPNETAGGAAKRDKEHAFEGVSNRRSFEEAFADALRQMDKAVAEQGRFPCTSVKWRVVDIGGESGSPAGLNILRVKITASFETGQADPVGAWKVTRTAHGEQLEGFTLTLKWKGDKLTGIADWPSGEIEAVAVDFQDDKLSFNLKHGDFIQQYSGQLSGDTITGKYAAGIVVREWEAQREPAAAAVEPDPTGVWKGILTWHGDEKDKGQQFVLTLSRDGDQLAGKLTWPDGTENQIVPGAAKFDRGELSFEVKPRAHTAYYRGKLTGDTIRGTVGTFLVTGVWEATRQTK
jgi:hypothetical protein